MIFFSMFSASLGHSLKIFSSSWNQWYHLFQEELHTVYPPLFPSAMFDLRRFSGSGRTKTLVTENYTILNKRNVHMQWITTLETWQVMFFWDAIHPGTCCTASTAVWAGQLRKLSFLCQYTTNWGIYCFKWLKLPSHEKWWIFPLRHFIVSVINLMNYFKIVNSVRDHKLLCFTLTVHFL